MTAIGNVIRRRRLALNMSVTEMAAALHASKATISRYEKGDRNISIQALSEIAEVLKTTPETLLKEMAEEEKSMSKQITTDETRMLSDIRNLSPEHKKKVANVINELTFVQQCDKTKSDT